MEIEIEMEEEVEVEEMEGKNKEMKNKICKFILNIPYYCVVVVEGLMLKAHWCIARLKD